MPNFVNNNPLAEAAEYGGAAGQSLAQAMYGVPLQRAEMAMRLAELQKQTQQMQQMGQYRNSLLGIQQERADEMGQYHQDEEARRTQTAQMLNQFRQLQAANAQQANQIKMLTAQNQQTRLMQPQFHNGFMYQPQQGVGQPQGNPMMAPQGPGYPQGGGMPLTAQQTINQVPQQGGQGLPVGVTQLPQQPRPQPLGAMTSGMASMQRDYMGGIGSTNPAVVDFAHTNILPQLMQLQQRMAGQQSQQPANTNRMFNWDPITGLQPQ